MGSDRHDDDEKPQHACDLPYDYWMAKYPVTVAQFRAFVKESGYDDFDEDALGDPDNRPVRYVTWYNALAYCDWLQEQLSGISEQLSVRDDPFWKGLAEGKLRVTLPNEAEWEKAARGGSPLPRWSSSEAYRDQGEGLGVREYPWGNDFDPNKANTAESGIGTTSAVGCFPGGAGPYGALDMSGNLREWTRSLWGKDWDKADFGYPYQPSAKREDLEAPRDILRVLRGGLFSTEAEYARCASRRKNLPDSRYGAYGFRVVVSPLLLSR